VVAAAAYLMGTFDWSVDKALEFYKLKVHKRDRFGLNKKFYEQLKNFEKILESEKEKPMCKKFNRGDEQGEELLLSNTHTNSKKPDVLKLKILCYKIKKKKEDNKDKKKKKTVFWDEKVVDNEVMSDYEESESEEEYIPRRKATPRVGVVLKSPHPNAATKNTNSLRESKKEKKIEEIQQKVDQVKITEKSQSIQKKVKNLKKRVAEKVESKPRHNSKQVQIPNSLASINPFEKLKQIKRGQTFPTTKKDHIKEPIQKSPPIAEKVGLAQQRNIASPSSFIAKLKNQHSNEKSITHMKKPSMSKSNKDIEENLSETEDTPPRIKIEKSINRVRIPGTGTPMTSEFTYQKKSLTNNQSMVIKSNNSQGRQLSLRGRQLALKRAHSSMIESQQIRKSGLQKKLTENLDERKTEAKFKEVLKCDYKRDLKSNKNNGNSLKKLLIESPRRDREKRQQKVRQLAKITLGSDFKRDTSKYRSPMYKSSARNSEYKTFTSDAKCNKIRQSGQLIESFNTQNGHKTYKSPLKPKPNIFNALAKRVSISPQRKAMENSYYKGAPKKKQKHKTNKISCVNNFINLRNSSNRKGNYRKYPTYETIPKASFLSPQTGANRSERRSYYLNKQNSSQIQNYKKREENPSNNMLR
jgi:hypothetical protein